ncbi:MAG: hypothetical protein ACSHYA_10150 [Opitutaceae bacterium]
MSPSKYLAIALTLLTSAATAEVLFSEDFESESAVGTAPYKASTLRPKQNEPGKAIVIIGERHNIAGTGNGIYLQDRLTGGEDSISLEYDFVDAPSEEISALRIDFSFAKGGTTEVKKDKLYFGAGEYYGGNSSKMNATARRYFQVEFLDSDAVKFNTASGKDKTVQLTKPTDNFIAIFINDHDKKAIEYAHPVSGETQKLAVNTVAYYLNGELAHQTKLDLDDATESGTVGTTENNFGRMGFYSSTKSDNNAWVFDNLKVTKL